VNAVDSLTESKTRSAANSDISSSRSSRNIFNELNIYGDGLKEIEDETDILEVQCDRLV